MKKGGASRPRPLQNLLAQSQKPYSAATFAE